MPPDLPAVIERLWRAYNARDADALAACLHPDYESLHPQHPERNFRGREAARRSWAAIFAAIPDLRAELVHCSFSGGEVATAWRWCGAHVDGPAFHAEGVVVMGLCGDRIAWARFYTETRTAAGPDFDALLDEILSGD
jgi:ketosteroid isomerase-like protein